jgi:2-iminobutanoate/2-iminopropanoate deaminase
MDRFGRRHRGAVAGRRSLVMVVCQFDFKFKLLRTFMKLPKTAVAMLGIVLLASADAADRKYIVNPRPADAKSLPFSDGVLVGDTLYIAGHIGLDPKTGQAPADPEQEAHRVMDGIKTTVEAAGLSMDDVVSVEIFCTDLKLYETFNAVYKTYFHGQYPARAFIGTDKLLRGGRYEVMGIAIKKTN